MPTVSIIVPLYNKAPYVKTALDSIAAQTYTDYECIIINDGSTDESVEVVNNWLNSSIHQSINSSFRLISQPNGGVSAARNRGISESESEFVAFLDADDWWEPTFLEEVVKLADEYPDAGIWASNYWYYKPGKTHVAVKNVYSVEGRVYSEDGWSGYMNYPKTYYHGEMPVWTGAVMLQRSIIEKPEMKDENGEVFPVGIKLGEDFLLWSKIALQYPVAFLNKPLAFYNNDVPATLRLTRHLHAPETHMLWQMEHIPETGDWKILLDQQRVGGLLKYWMSNEYHDLALIELKKVDWNQQPYKVKLRYHIPVGILKTYYAFMKIGSYFKQKVTILFYL